MIKFFIACCIGFFFLTCNELHIEPQLDKNYLDSIFTQIRKIDPTAKLLSFYPENIYFDFGQKEVADDYIDVDSVVRNGNVSSIIETDYEKESDSSADLLKTISTTEYHFINNRLSEKKTTDSSGIETRKFIYGIRGNCTEVSFYAMSDSGRFIMTYNDKNLKEKDLFDHKGKKFMSIRIVNDEVGNPGYVYTKSDDDYFEKFEFNNKKRQLLLSRFSNRKRFQWLRYTEFNRLGQEIYQERFRRYSGGFVLIKDSYTFNEQNEIESLQSSSSKRAEMMKFNFIYSQIDSQNNWRLRETYQNNILFLSTKRVVFYNESRK